MENKLLSAEDFMFQLPSKDKEINDLAWKIFKEKLGLRFTHELSVEQKKSITDEESYQYYIEEGEKLYNKRMASKAKALTSKQYKIIDVPANGNPEWYGGAFTLAFVYSKYNGNFILRGYVKEVQEYLKKNYTHYFYNLTMFGGLRSRNIWYFWKENIGIFEPSSRRHKTKESRRYNVRKYHCSYDKDTETTISFSFKRLPKRWISEFDSFN